jgi:hypothetical protein
MMRHALLPGRLLATALALVTLTACDRSPTAPELPLNPAQVVAVRPAVADAGARVAAGVQDPVLRERTLYHLGLLDAALRTGDAAPAKLHARVVGNLLQDHMAQPGAARRPDAADISALTLTLHHVSTLLGIPYDISRYSWKD